MAIARKPNILQTVDREAAAEQFIGGASTPVAPPQPAVKAPEPAAVAKRTPTMIRFDTALLARVDRAARRRGISRSAWIAYTLSHALDEEDR